MAAAAVVAAAAGTAKYDYDNLLLLFPILGKLHYCKNYSTTDNFFFRGCVMAFFVVVGMCLGCLGFRCLLVIWVKEKLPKPQTTNCKNKTGMTNKTMINKDG